VHWDRGVVGSKDERGSVDGLRKCACHDQFATPVRLVQKPQMLFTIWNAASDVIFENFVEQNVVHFFLTLRFMPFSPGSCTARFASRSFSAANEQDRAVVQIDKDREVFHANGDAQMLARYGIS
jgi:hypothetical protein